MACSCCGELEKKMFFEKQGYVITSLVVGAIAIVLSLFWESISKSVSWLTYLNPAWVPIVMCGIPLFYSAFYHLFKGKIKSALLITVAMIACITLEVLCWTGVVHVDEHSHNLLAAAEVAFLMMIGEFIENVTVGKTRKGIEALYSLAPDVALIDLGGQFVEFPVSFVKVGDIVRVMPHQKIPVDGIVAVGSTSVNQSAITGESLPIDKKVGDEVFAGTFNEHSLIDIKVTKPSDQTVVSKMIELVKHAEENKAPIARIADKWASRIVPMAIILSVLVFLFSKLIFPDTTWLDSLVRGVTILVVFCPCSLALATPTAISAGIGNAGSCGILIKSGQALETLSSVDTVVFDKTGTLTKGTISVDDVQTEMDEKQFLTYLGTAESTSEHPLATPLTQYCKEKVQLATPQDSRSLVGIGVWAKIDDKEIIVAKYSHFESDKFSDSVKLWHGQGKTVVGMSIDGVLVGVVALSDTIREGSATTIEQLHKLGINTVMLTGDAKDSALAIGDLCKIGETKWGLLPEDKVNDIKQMSQTNKVLMVGDGVNDAPALASANCSLAMGKMGSDAALEVADMVLFNDKVEKIPFLVKLSRKVLSTIKRNIAISMTINLVAVVLSFFGWLNPVFGAIVHNCSSVFVVLSSALLLLEKDKKGIDKK
ncbi:MAG: cadmium-translocating P-type ATPase [Clostridia bacterium]|nr:cadmium-translocating P-type ATPase [Clostridia bacterium]